MSPVDEDVRVRTTGPPVFVAGVVGILAPALGVVLFAWGQRTRSAFALASGVTLVVAGALAAWATLEAASRAGVSTADDGSTRMRVGLVLALLGGVASVSALLREIALQCRRRWWVGSVADALRSEHRFDPEVATVLAMLIGRFGAGDPDVDAIGRTVEIADRVLPVVLQEDVWVGELPAVALSSALERVAHRTAFGPPVGRFGVGPDAGDLAGWSRFVIPIRDAVLRIAMEQPDDLVVSYVS